MTKREMRTIVKFTSVLRWCIDHPDQLAGVLHPDPEGMFEVRWVPIRRVAEGEEPTSATADTGDPHA